MGAGKSDVLFSGTATTNTYAYRRFSIIGYGETTIILSPGTITSGSTLSYAIRGYPASDLAGDTPAITVPIVTDYTISSGRINVHTISDAYDELDLGVKSTDSDKSGAITVYVTRKRRG